MVTKLTPLITLNRKVGAGEGEEGRPARIADKKAENVQRGRKASHERLFTFSKAKAVFLNEEDHSRGRARQSQLQGAGRRGGGRTTARSEAPHGSGRPPESPGRSAAPSPPPSRPPHARRRRVRAAHAAGVATSTLLGVGTPDVGRRGRRCLTCCYQARAQPISSRRRRRPAFELGTATSCCLASTQCNAVCLSALRHKGTAIL